MAPMASEHAGWVLACSVLDSPGLKSRVSKRCILQKGCSQKDIALVS
jgi:hypothetical protein